ncbi:MAG: S1 RNA-binding domain-containing protein [Eubacteriales bacterium]
MMILPEGRYLHTEENQELSASKEGLLKAKEEQIPLEAIALRCEEGLGITVSLGNFIGFIPWFQGALGLETGLVREIAVMSRIGRPIAFLVEDILEENGRITPILSRSRLQQQAKDHILSLRNGTVLPATITRLETFGAFVDIGCGIASLISNDRISISRITHPSQRFQRGQEIYVAILEHDWQEERVRVTHRELLGSWSENASKFSIGMTLPGMVRSIKNYGIFVELSPNFSGLAEVVDGIIEGQRVSVYIKGILPDKMKCKLLIIGELPPADPYPLSYFLPETGQLSHWNYATEGCEKSGGETFFHTF